MCGIYGAFATGGRDVRELQPSFAAMDEALRHRGPDDCGLHIDADGRVALGHRRLSILDLSAAGRQPMWNEAATVGLVFNGEIYNYRELRTALARDHRFRSATDSEVIVHGYEAYGEAILDRLDGMFAFALWDRVARRLLLARDRLGKKPLYYVDDRGLLVFASEMKALLHCPDVSRDLNVQAVSDYLTFGYVPAPATMFSAIQKLPAGNVAQCDVGGVRTRRFWNVPSPLGAGTATRSTDQQIRTLVDAAVAKRLIADVPLAALLSGGVDSTIVVSTMARLLGRGVRTFTVGFEKGGAKINDDLLRARETARRYATDHQEFVLDTSNLDLPALLRSTVWHLDEPIANATTLTTMALGSTVRQAGLKVVLTGDGGDELFAGYPRYLYDLWAGRAAAALPRGARRVAAAALGQVSALPLARGAGRFLAKVDEISDALPAERYLAWRRHFSTIEQHSVLSAALRSRLSGYNASAGVADELAGIDAPSMQDRLAYVDLKFWVADESNMRVDRGMMAHGIEARCPLLDQALVEYAFSLPYAQKIRGRQTKALLKRAFAAELPQAVAAGVKRGFLSPVRDWMNTAMSATLEEVFTPTRLERIGLLDPAGVQALRGDAAWKRRPNKLWSLLVLQLWGEAFLR
jgi:asparagine synthase (glutamine-hydrolysing)